MKENLRILIEGMASRYLMMFPVIILCSEMQNGDDVSVFGIILAVATLAILTVVVFHTSAWLVNHFCEGKARKLRVLSEVILPVLLLKRNLRMVMEYYLADDDFDDGGTTEEIQETRQMFFRKGVLIYGT